MHDQDWMAEQFESHRAHMRAVAYRMLGSASEADDAVQEAWLRLSRSETSDVGNLRGWLTTVIARICLDMLRARRSRRVLRTRSMFSATRATTVVSQARRFPTSLVSVRLSRSQAS